MSKWKENKDERVRLTKLRARIDRIFTDTDRVRRDMERYLKEYTGMWYNELELTERKDKSRVFVNYIFTTANSIAPLLTDNRPIWALRARKPFLQKQFNLYSLCLEYLWDKLDMDMRTFRWVLDALIMKLGVAKIWFDPDDNEVRFEVVDPRTYFCAPGYDDNWEAPFQGTRERKPLSWVREMFPDKYDEIKADSDIDQVWSSDVGKRTDKQWTYDSDNYENMSDEVTVYELWMRDPSVEKEDVYEKGKPVKDEKGKTKQQDVAKYPHGKIMYFTRDVLLEEKASPYRHSKPPYVLLYDYMVPHNLFGMGEADQIETLNRSINRGFQLMDKTVETYGDPNYLVDGNAGIDLDNVKENLPGGGNVWEYNSTMNSEPIKQIKLGELPDVVYQFVAALPKVIEEVTGVTDISKGMQVKSERQTAAEVSTLIESSYTRTRQRVRNLEHSLKRSLWLMTDLMQQFYTDVRDINVRRDEDIEYAKVSNKQTFINAMMQPQEENPEEDEQKDWEEYKKFIAKFGDTDEVYADFDLTIETNSTLPMDRQSLANLFLRLLQMKAIDPQAVLEQLRIPKGEEIIERLNKKEQMAMQAKGGPPQGGPIPMPKQTPTLQSRPEGVG